MVFLNISLQQRNPQPLPVVVALAAYTFWKAAASAVHFIRVRSKQSPLLYTLRGINCADAAASLLTLQHAMFSTFHSKPNSLPLYMDGALGLAVFLFVLLLGIRMIVRGGRIYRQDRSARARSR